MDSFHIHEDKLDDAFMVSRNIPEFDDSYEISEYSKRLNSTVHLILTAYNDHNPIAFKIGYQRHPDGSFCLKLDPLWAQNESELMDCISIALSKNYIVPKIENVLGHNENVSMFTV